MTSGSVLNPATTEERLDRLEAIEQIRQLPHRYALAVDTRNIDDLVALFVDDVRVGRDQSGRAAMKAWFAETLSAFADSIHFVGNHVIDFESPIHASGTVTCRDELEVGGEWRVGMIQYWDKYEKRDGVWYFVRRKLHRWYLADALTRPFHGAGIGLDPLAGRGDGQLPDAWPSWAEYWKGRGRTPR
jgi:hypothetical protein